IRDATEAAERCLIREYSAGAVVKGPRSYIAFGLGMTGGGGVDAVLARGQFERQPLGQSFEGPLRGCVKQGSRHRMRADDGAEIDDAPAAGAEARDRFLHRENRPKHVDVEVQMKALFGDLSESAEAEDASVVDQNVESSECGIDFIE